MVAIASKHDQTILVDQCWMAISRWRTNSRFYAFLLVRLYQLQILNCLCFPFVHLLIINVEGIWVMLDYKCVSQIVSSRSLNVPSFVVLILLLLGGVFLLLLRDFMGKVKVSISFSFTWRFSWRANCCLIFVVLYRVLSLLKLCWCELSSPHWRWTSLYTAFMFYIIINLRPRLGS